MKKAFYRILLTAAILPTVGSGCVNEEREHHDPVVQLAFEPVMHAQVRAGETPDNTGDTGNNSFGVSAWTLDQTQNWSSESENAEPFLDREKLLRDGVFWYPESKPDWPPYQYNLACIGFAPFDAAARCDNSQGVVFDDVDTSTDPGDLRYTLLQANLSKNRNGGVISLPMIPALCEVSFRVRGVSEYETTRFFVRSISLENVKLKGSFHSLPNPSWDLQNLTGEINFFEGDWPVGYSSQDIGETRRIIPQDLDASLRVAYDVVAPSQDRIPEEVSDVEIKRTLSAGHQYTFTLAISASGVEVIQENPSQID